MTPQLRRRLLIAAALLLWPLAALAQPAAPANDDCLTCHGDPSTTRANGQPVVVDVTTFSASIHGQLELNCVDCHADLAAAELPHPEKLAPVDCSTCHDDPATKLKTSIHSAVPKTEGLKVPTCASCHGSHDILPSKDPNSRTYHLNIAKTCAVCHGSSAMAKEIPGSPQAVSQFADSIHGQALSKSGLVVAPTCVNCHGSHDVREPKDPQSRVFRTTVPQTCGACHEGIKHQFSRGIHGEQVAKGNAQAPVCVDCHSAHNIQSAEKASWRLDVIRECGTCHGESLVSYRDTFHGQVTELGFARVATCADCHGAHEILPATNPKSPVSPTGRVETCRKCHPSANANFAAYDPHANPHDRGRNPLLYFTARFMELLLLGVFGFFGVHSGLWFVRSWRALRDRRRNVVSMPARAGDSDGPGQASDSGEAHGGRG